MAGKIIFAEIPRLSLDWQNGTPTDNPSIVWTVWDKNNYYLWGANSGNISGIAIGQTLHGGGLAGPNGPTRGLAHPHYVGVNTMESNKMNENTTAFNYLSTLLADGKDVVIPIFHDKGAPAGEYKYSLGTGIGSNVSNWMDIQRFIFKCIISLCDVADSVEIPDGVYWPDCRTASKTHYPITNAKDIRAIVALV